MSRSLKNKEHVQKLEEAQMLKKKETKINSRYALNNLRETMAAEQTRNHKHLTQLQKIYSTVRTQPLVETSDRGRMQKLPKTQQMRIEIRTR